ncbi:MAG: hypothetical protein OXH63_10130 [Gemmatimonadetes bacterium]|nr:hypothetical protein [Gemmatimonadota bacterium]
MPLSRTAICLLLALVLLSPLGVRAELDWATLNSTREITEAEWLQVQLSVLGLKLSYPAYRIDLKLTEDSAIEFTFIASSGMAEHLTEDLGKSEAEEVISYHAQGISDQVEALVRDEFPDLWSGFDVGEDVRGQFLGPGEKWNDPPREIGTWLENQFSWGR